MTTPTAASIDRLSDRLGALSNEVANFGPRSVPTALRRDHVLAAATLAFVADGFDGASMAGIASRAGVTKPVVYGLFGSKEQLFAAVIDHVGDQMQRHIAIATAAGGRSRLVDGVRAYLLDAAEQQHLWGPVFATAARYSAVSDAVHRLHRRQVDLIVAALRRGHEEHGIDADPREIEALAHLVIGAVQSVAQWWSRHPELDVDEVTAFLDTTLSPALAALRADRPSADWFSAPAEAPDAAP